MKQIKNIFFKDVRQYWREATAVMVLFAAYGWNEVHSWTYRDDLIFASRGLFSQRFMSGLIDFLLPTAWIFLTVRAVQGESLVGDRQFWLTRPYERPKLLAAKCLLLLVFINLPLLVLDITLLSLAGFSPSNHITGLLWMQAMIVLFVMLPALALATVTATIMQVALGVVIIALYLLGVVWLAEQIPSSSFSGPVDSISPYIFVVVCLVIVFLQYAWRKTSISRSLIIGLGVVFLLLVVGTPYQTIVSQEYPRLSVSQPVPFQVSIVPPELSSMTSNTLEERKEFEMQVPLAVESIPSESIVNVSAIMISIEGPNDFRWNSGWKSSGMHLFPGQKNTIVNFTIKRSLLERVRAAPVKLRISLGFTLFHDRNQRRFTVPQGEFELSEGGRCAVRPSYTPFLHCLAPMREPSNLLVASDISESTCPLRPGESRSNKEDIARDWLRNGDSDPAEFGISPIQEFSVYLWGSNNNSGGVCPGTSLVLSNPEPVFSSQVDVQAEGVRLIDYRDKDLPIIFSAVKPKT